MFLIAFLTVAPANGDVIAFIDNSVALHCMVKATSTNPANDRTVHLVHLLALSRGIRIWFELIRPRKLGRWHKQERLER